MSAKIAEIVTNKICEQLQKGVAPWRSPYLFKKQGALENYKTKHKYTGINLFLLWDTPTGKFLSFKQAQELGFSVKKGAKANMCLFFTKFTPKDSEVKFNKKGEQIDNSIPCMRYYNVFDIADIEGLESEVEKLIGKGKPDTREFEADCYKADSLATDYLNREKIELKNIDDRCGFYSITKDYINMPKDNFIESKFDWYATLFHEIAHSTGAPSRLDRPIVGKNAHNIDKYSREELIAEITSAFLCHHTGIGEHLLSNQANYCAEWLKFLKNDPSAIINAAGKAQKAYNFVLGNDSQDGKESSLDA